MVVSSDSPTGYGSGGSGQARLVRLGVPMLGLGRGEARKVVRCVIRICVCLWVGV